MSEKLVAAYIATVRSQAAWRASVASLRSVRSIRDGSAISSNGRLLACLTRERVLRRLALCYIVEGTCRLQSITAAPWSPARTRRPTAVRRRVAPSCCRPTAPMREHFVSAALDRSSEPLGKIN
jgi:hypothetical protein